MAIVKWELDPDHSEIQFKVKHLMITTVTGTFRKFSVEVETEDDDFSKASHIRFKADADSIDTNNVQRDNHLKSEDFLNSKNYPQIKFTGKGFQKSEGKMTLSGNLTINGITQIILVDVELGGIATDPYGHTKAGFSISGKIDRRAFGLIWGSVTEAGKIVLSDEVRFQGEIQLIKQSNKM